MKEERHRDALEQLRASRALLDPVKDIRLYSEASHGMAIHAVAAGFSRRHGMDYDQHQALARRLRENGHPEIANAFAELEEIRAGRWYGGQGNGDTVHRIDELLAKIEEWSLG
ncbi:MAG: hypothetical protein M1358_04775 [Chloroflexi bacterium]|nr:hypothetical protein [Chloroflexota bacterium]